MLCILPDATLVELYRGDSLIVNFTTRWEDGTLADLTPFNARFLAAGSIIKNSTVPGEIDIPNPINGQFLVHLIPEDTENLQKNYNYEYSAQIYDVSGNVYTIAKGVFRVL